MTAYGCEGFTYPPGSQDANELRCDKNPNHPRCDTRSPSVSITNPSSGSTVSGSINVAGAASDDRTISRVELSVDNGAYQLASGTQSWSFGLETSGLGGGSHTLTARAIDAGGNAAVASISVEVSAPANPPPTPPTTPPSTAGYGPQASITCPVGAINISPGQNIPSIVDAHPTGTTFCVLAGVHYTSAPINLKANDKLIGQYGAIIDGRSVTMTYDISSTSIVRGWNCGATDCSGGVVQNLVLRNLATSHCVGVYGPTSNNWTIDHNEIHGCLNGVNVGYSSGARVTNNYIHHNIGNSSAADPAERGGGYGSYLPTNTLWEHNEIAYNGQNQKICGSTNVTFRNNYLHHNVSDGIWYDGDNTQMLIEGNTLEDHGREGIFLEISAEGIVRNNIIRRSGGHGIFVSTTRDTDIYSNTLEDNFRGISYFLNCAAVGFIYPTSIGFDLRNVNSHDNVIKMGNQSGAWASDFSYLGSCTPTELAPYRSGSKNLLFQNNHYYVPSTSDGWWLAWDSLVTWSQWRALPQDSNSTVALASTYSGSPPPPPPTGPDVLPPTVSVFNPPESSVVSGVVVVVANAADNVGVVGVQLKVDGVNVGAEMFSSPYSVSWNTAGLSNGNHVLQAVARDAAGNYATSAANTVTVSN